MKTTDNRTFSVYMHTAPDGRIYVGMTSQAPEMRWLKGEAYKSNPAFYEVIQEEGWDNIEHEIVETGLTKAEAAELERELISEFNTTDSSFGFNNSTGGECCSFGSGQTIYCPETRTLYSNASAAAHDLGLHPSALCHDGKHRGLTLVRMDEEEAEQHMMFEEIEAYNITLEDLEDENICNLLFG